MTKRLCGILVLFFLISSNLSSSLIGAYFYIADSNTKYKYSLNIQNQYNLIVNIPKNFINMCVEVSKEIKFIKMAANKFSNISANTKTFFNASTFAVILNTFKLKTYYSNSSVSKTNIPLIQTNNIFYLFMVILIFYLTAYIGLLRLFNVLNYTKYNIIVFFKLCLSNIRQSFVIVRSKNEKFV